MINRVYIVYHYSQSKVKIYDNDRVNSDTTKDVLEKIRADLPHDNITVIWGGASYHRSLVVREAAQSLQIELQPLPAYSPNFMPVEHLRAWLREDVTYHTCYETLNNS